MWNCLCIQALKCLFDALLCVKSSSFRFSFDSLLFRPNDRVSVCRLVWLYDRHEVFMSLGLLLCCCNPNIRCCLLSAPYGGVWSCVCLCAVYVSVWEYSANFNFCCCVFFLFSNRCWFECEYAYSRHRGRCRVSYCCFCYLVVGAPLSFPSLTSSLCVRVVVCYFH